MRIIKKDEYNPKFTSSSRWAGIIWYYHSGNLQYVKNDLDAINILLDSDFDSLSNYEFYNLISNFYSIFIAKKDFANIFNKINNIEYDELQMLNTRMTFKDVVTEGHGRDFSWWEETFQSVWIVVTSKDLSLNPEYNYSKEEIQKMVEKKQIIVFKKTAKGIGIDPELTYQPEEVTQINALEIDFSFEEGDMLTYDLNLDFNFNLLKSGDSEFAKNVYNEFFSVIRKRLDKKRVLADCNKILLFLKDNIQELEYKSEEIADNKEHLDLIKEIVNTLRNLLIKTNNI